MNPDKETDAPTDAKSTNALAEKAVERAFRIVANCNRYKQPRLDKIQMYRDLYAGKVKKKYRQPFNAVLPVFSGMLDTLMAAFNDDLALDFKEQEPADYLAIKKLNALWDMEAESVAPNAKFALKTREDRSNALFSGRGFMVNYAQSMPEYRNNFEIYELEDAIFEPRGGGQLENHNYNGRQNIVRSASELQAGSYDQTQVAELLRIAAKTDFYPEDSEDTRSALSKFRAMGLNTKQADYVGEQLFKLVEMRLTMDGVKYYLVFSPWYRVWLRFAPFKEVFSGEIDPWISWATHEDNKNFLSKSYADDIYGVADAIHTIFNQELLNREKSNYNARAYDKDMFPDVAKLDQAQTRPDGLVPVDTKGGARKIADGIYSFQVAQLSGSINLIDWIQQQTGTDVGATDLAMGAAQGAAKRATVILAEQQATAKRMLLRSSSYTEAMSEVGKLFFQGCKDHLPASKAIRLLGADGEGWNEITRADLDLYSDVDVKIISSSIEMQNSAAKKEARMKILAEIGADPTLVNMVNPHWRAEELLRSGAEYDDAEIKIAMDTKNYGNKEEVARAHEAIQEVLANQTPEKYYGATTLFMQIIHDFAVDNRNDIGSRKYQILIAFEMAHAPIAQQNMLRQAMQNNAMQPPIPQPQPQTGFPPNPNVPSPAATMASVPTV